MTPVILDTSAYSNAGRGDTRLRKWISANSSDKVILPTIVIGELRGGFALGNDPHGNEQTLQRFLGMPHVSVVSITDATTHIFAELYAKLRKTGKAFGQNDLWIASLAIENKAKLITFDKDFLSIKGLDAEVLAHIV